MHEVEETPKGSSRLTICTQLFSAYIIRMDSDPVNEIRLCLGRSKIQNKTGEFHRLISADRNIKTINAHHHQ